MLYATLTLACLGLLLGFAAWLRAASHSSRLDELEARAHELPRDGKPIIIYCAAGVRSAAACHYLSSLGHDSLHNLAGGYPAWTGPRATA